MPMPYGGKSSSRNQDCIWRPNAAAVLCVISREHTGSKRSSLYSHSGPIALVDVNTERNTLELNQLQLRNETRYIVYITCALHCQALGGIACFLSLNKAKPNSCLF